MAIHIMEFKGKIANVVFYRRNGKNYARTRPRKYKRTAAMKLRSRNFGIAASTAKLFRRQLTGLIPFPANKTMQSRFVGAFAKWIGKRDISDLIPELDISSLYDFQFNEKCRLMNRWKTELIVLNPGNGLMQVQIPAFIPVEAMTAPPDTVSVTVWVAAAAVNPATAVPGSSFTTQLEIQYSGTVTVPYLVNLPVQTDPGMLVLTAAALQYQVSKKGNVNTIPSDDPAYLPAAVVEARYF